MMSPHLQQWLQRFLSTHGAIAGTLHLPVEDQLHLVAAVNIPEPVVRATTQIPRGKGMGGLAWSRGEPVSTCDLQTPSPDVRPGARQVAASAAVALPLRDPAGEIVAILGVAYQDARTLSPADLTRLTSAAADLPRA